MQSSLNKKVKGACISLALRARRKKLPRHLWSALPARLVNDGWWLCSSPPSNSISRSSGPHRGS